MHTGQNVCRWRHLLHRRRGRGRCLQSQKKSWTTSRRGTLHLFHSHRPIVVTDIVNAHPPPRSSSPHPRAQAGPLARPEHPRRAQFGPMVSIEFASPSHLAYDPRRQCGVSAGLRLRREALHREGHTASLYETIQLIPPLNILQVVLATGVPILRYRQAHIECKATASR
ncbi:hypothetical protein DENSPDRAFT_223085 [Dentipellis sp. KUC8613]|nr:hypothetical protein DENSPDRAFT_223085 [Dentipellis sp. KUC8613]